MGTRWAGRWAGRIDDVLLAAACAVAVGLTVWATRAVWQPGLPTGVDVGAHAVRARHAIESFFPRAQYDGWQSAFGLGYQQSLFVGPGHAIVVGLVRSLSFGVLSPLDALKATMVLSLAAVPLGTAFVTCSCGFSRRAAAVAALLALTVSTMFGGAGIDGTFGIGLLPNQVASGFVLLAIGGIVRLLRGPSPRRIVGTALAAAAVALTHPVALEIVSVLTLSLVAGAALEWLVVQRRARPDLAGGRLAVARLGGLAGAGALALGLAAVQLAAIAGHLDLRGLGANWPDSDLPLVVGQMWRGEFLFAPTVFVLVVVGFVAAVVRARQRPVGFTVVVGVLVFLALGRAFITVAPTNELAIQLTNRSFAYLALLSLVPLASLLADASVAAGELAALRARSEMRTRAAVHVGGGIGLVALVALPFLVGGVPDQEAVGTVTPTPVFARATEQLRARVPEQARFVLPRMMEVETELTGVPHADFWAAWASGRDTLNIFNVESSHVHDAIFVGEAIADVDPNAGDPDARADALARVGVSHVLVVDTTKATRVAGSPRFRPVWAEGPMVIYEVTAPTGQPDPAALISSRTASLRATSSKEHADHRTIAVHAEAATTATVAMAWSPKWRATLDGAEVPLRGDAEGLIEVDLPAETSQLDLRFSSDGWDRAGRAVTLASLALAVIILRRARRRSPVPADVGPRGPGGPGEASVDLRDGHATEGDAIVESGDGRPASADDAGADADAAAPEVVGAEAEPATGVGAGRPGSPAS